MKMIDNDNALFSPSTERMEELREKLRERISREELDYSWRLEALDEIFTSARLDSSTFHRLWIRPLLAAGLSLEVAIIHVVDSFFMPN